MNARMKFRVPARADYNQNECKQYFVFINSGYVALFFS
jgi:hypothetical protein